MSLKAFQGIKSVGNGKGFIYVVDPEDTSIFKVFDNSSEGFLEARAEAVKNIPFGHNVPSSGQTQFLTVTGVGTVTQYNVGGVNQLPAAGVIFTGLSGTTLATAIETAIEGFDPGSPNYRATKKVDVVFIEAPAEDGDIRNSDTINIVTSGVGSITFTSIDPSGGSSAGKDTLRENIYVDADFNLEGCSGGGVASASTIDYTTAVLINSEIIPKSINSGQQLISDTISGGKAGFERKANFTIFSVSAEGGGPLDDLVTLDTEGFHDQDLILIVQGTSGETITVKSTGNCVTEGSVDAVVDSATKSILLRYNATDKTFDEAWRTSVLTISDATLKAGNISHGVSGVETYTIAPGGGADAFDISTGKAQVILDGNSVALVGPYTLTANASLPLNPVDGVSIRALFRPVASTTASITIFGLALTSHQQKTGAIIEALYDNATLSFETKIIPDGNTQFIENGKIPTNEISTDRLELQAGIVAGSYTNVDVTIDPQGIITAISNGVVGSGTALANILYVDPNGNNSTAIKGDIYQAWADVTTALTVAAPGDTIILTTGVHNERIILEDEVDLYFMQGAKLIYTGADGAVISDDGSGTPVNCNITGYPYIEHAGTGANKYAFNITSAAATHQIRFENTHFYSTVVELVFKIDGTLSRVSFHDCIFRQNANTNIGELTDFDRVHFYDSWFVNENSGLGTANGVTLGDDGSVYDGCKFYLLEDSNDCFLGLTSKTIKLYSTLYTNADSGFAAIGIDLTNLIVGTDLIKDSDLEFYIP